MPVVPGVRRVVIGQLDSVRAVRVTTKTGIEILVGVATLTSPTAVTSRYLTIVLPSQQDSS
jgi:hypothetical protein